ncbi:hypothetical protein AB0M46_37350 [Dactylosporangium sp. NPDC051485]|uniref:hypothetical protein n=1 Tax=Dactylosporangium sp. NPDC051485 TaxID=3154846 RepID=UPI003441854D
MRPYDVGISGAGVPGVTAAYHPARRSRRAGGPTGAVRTSGTNRFPAGIARDSAAGPTGARILG